jgi:transcriptional regulator GlxA family with amidase domain
MNTIRAGIILTHRFTLNALANFVDVLRLAADEGDGSRPIRCRWHVMSPTSTPIIASCGIQTSPTSALIDPKSLDYVVVIGGLLRGDGKIDDAIRRYLLRANLSGSRLIGICTGSFVLCRLGLMKDRRCCISWYHNREFRDEFDDIEPITDAVYVVDGDRITCSGGVGASLTAAHLVESHFGHSLAQKALHIMQIDRARPGATLQPAPPLIRVCKDASVTRALIVMEQNLSKPIAISQIAETLHMSTRKLQRLFDKHLGCGPLTAYLHLRLRHAHWMLSGGVPTVDVVLETGFANRSQFSAAFKRVYGLSASEVSHQAALHAGPSALVRLEADRRIFSLTHAQEGQVCI